eukprot:3003335-Rhodomonas_salina.2
MLDRSLAGLGARSLQPPPAADQGEADVGHPTLHLHHRVLGLGIQTVYTRRPDSSHGLGHARQRKIELGPCSRAGRAASRIRVRCLASESTLNSVGIPAGLWPYPALSE